MLGCKKAFGFFRLNLKGRWSCSSSSAFSGYYHLEKSWRVKLSRAPEVSQRCPDYSFGTGLGCWSAGKAIFLFTDGIPRNKTKGSWKNFAFRSPQSFICHHSKGSLTQSSSRTQVLHWPGQLQSHNIPFSRMQLAPSTRPTPFWTTNTT